MSEFRWKGLSEEEKLKWMENEDLSDIDILSDDGKWIDHESDVFVNVDDNGCDSDK